MSTSHLPGSSLPSPGFDFVRAQADAGQPAQLFFLFDSVMKLYPWKSGEDSV